MAGEDDAVAILLDARRAGDAGLDAIDEQRADVGHQVALELFVALGDGELATEIDDHFRSLQYVAWENDFYHPSISEAFVVAMQAEMQLSDEDATALMCRYIIHSDDYVFDPRHSVLKSEDGLFEYPDGLSPDQINELSERARAVFAQSCADKL